MSEFGEHEPGPSRTWDNLVFRQTVPSAASKCGWRGDQVMGTGRGGTALG
jgi:hypothetical protein